jgi:heat shock protein HslJ
VQTKVQPGRHDACKVMGMTECVCAGQHMWLVQQVLKNATKAVSFTCTDSDR